MGGRATLYRPPPGALTRGMAGPLGAGGKEGVRERGKEGEIGGGEKGERPVGREDGGRESKSEGEMERKERAAAVRDAIAALPRELREAIVLFEYEEMSQAEIAVVVGASVKAVEARVARAKEKLRVALRRWV